MKPQQYWDNLMEVCENALKSVGEKAISIYPKTRFRMGRSSNAAFPARFWGSLSSLIHKNRESIDISIDFKWGDQTIEVMADVAYESGEILSELPVQYIPLLDVDTIVEDVAITAVNKVVDYVSRQWELIDQILQEQK